MRRPGGHSEDAPRDGVEAALRRFRTDGLPDVSHLLESHLGLILAEQRRLGTRQAVGRRGRTRAAGGRRRMQVRIAIVAAVIAVLVVPTLALAGELPGPLQRVAARLGDAVGIDVPRSPRLRSTSTAQTERLGEAGDSNTSRAGGSAAGSAMTGDHAADGLDVRDGDTAADPARGGDESAGESGATDVSRSSPDGDQQAPAGDVRDGTTVSDAGPADGSSEAVRPTRPPHPSKPTTPAQPVHTGTPAGNENGAGNGNNPPAAIPPSDPPGQNGGNAGNGNVGNDATPADPPGHDGNDAGGAGNGVGHGKPAA